jgi:hypothetical protein
VIQNKVWGNEPLEAETTERKVMDMVQRQADKYRIKNEKDIQSREMYRATH